MIMIMIMILMAIMIHPSVNAFSVKNMATVPQLPDFIVLPQLAKAYCTRFTDLWQPLHDIPIGGQHQIVSYHLGRNGGSVLCFNRGGRRCRGHGDSVSEPESPRQDPSHHCNYKSCFVQDMGYYQATARILQRETHFGIKIFLQGIKKPQEPSQQEEFQEKREQEEDEEEGGSSTWGIGPLIKRKLGGIVGDFWVCF